VSVRQHTLAARYRACVIALAAAFFDFARRRPLDWN
jgi:hypothetical protein